MIKNMFVLTAMAVASFICVQTSAQKINEPQSTNAQWSQPYPPFRIVGNLYYVGTYDLACYLIVTEKGNILINTGLAASASMIKESIEALGFAFADTKILLTTQAHFDHVGAMAFIKKRTGAKMMADYRDAGVLADGGSTGYELSKNQSTYEPVKVDRLLKNGDTITLGNMRVVMLHHPGHTKGSCSFLFDEKDEHKTYRVLIANLPTIVTDKKFSAISSYPDIAKDYAYTSDAMKKLSFDIWLSSHASQFELHTKHKPGEVYSPDAFVDQKGYDKSVSDLQAQYLTKIEEK
jgi:metallo-beta-lactamase class B